MSFRLGLSQGLLRSAARPHILPLNTLTRFTPPQSASFRALSTKPPTSTPLSLRTLLFRPPPKPSPFSNLFKRAFSTSPKNGIRETYFPPRGQRSGGRGPNRSGWFDNIRRRLDRLPDMTIIYGLIGLNVGVFLLWQYAWSSWTRFRDPSLYHWMQKNFILSEANIMAGRIWTVVTSAFSQSRGEHLFFNCLGLYFIAPAALSLVGGASFVGLYLAGGICSSLVSLAWHRFRRDRHPGSEGASGAIYTTLAFYSAMFPRATILMFFIIPMPVWLAVGGMFAYDLYGAIARPGSGIDSAGHIGGLLAGLFAAARFRRGGLGGLGRWR